MTRKLLARSSILLQAILKLDTLLAGTDKQIWLKSLANEIGRCSIGLSKLRKPCDVIKGNNTVFFIKPNCKVTYCNIVCTMRPNNSEVYRVRMTVGGDRLDAYQDVRSPVISTLDAKLHINSTISDAHKGARYCTTDIKDFFLCSTMQVYQYMRIHQHYIPSKVLDEYNLTSEHFDSKGFAYLEFRKGMYGLKEAVILAYDQLKDHLAKYGYIPFKHTPGMWRHTT